MAQINFNDKNAGDFLTPEDVNGIKNVVNANEGLISNGTVSGYYDSTNQFRYNHHIIPASNANFDIGSAEHKVRHLYLSPNSLWIGDENKIDASEGEVKTKKRNKYKLPNYITEVLGGTLTEALIFLDVSSAQEITLKGLEEYAKSLNSNITLSDIFPPETDPNYKSDDYELVFQQSEVKKKLEQSLTSHSDWSSGIGSELIFDFENLKKEYIIDLGGNSLTGEVLNIHVLKVPFDLNTFDFAQGLHFSFTTTFLFNGECSFPDSYQTLLFYERNGFDNPYCGVGDINDFTQPFHSQTFTQKISLKHSFLHLGAQKWIQDVSIDI